MKPLIVLLVVFIVTLAVTRVVNSAFDYALSARIAMTAMLLFTALGHFMYTQGMAMMVPDWVPYKTATVYETGILEILAAIGLLFPGLRVTVAWLLIVFFIVMLPANIKAAIAHIDYQKGTYDGSGPGYLWFRVPLQLFFIAWVYFSALKK